MTHSRWNVESLLELMNERDRRYEATRIAAEKAIQIAEKHAEQWRENANEWRQAMTDRERTFLPRSLGYIFVALSVIALVVSLAEKLTK